MQNNIEILNIDGKDYTVITQVKSNSSVEEIYNVLVRYALEKIDERIKKNNKGFWEYIILLYNVFVKDQLLFWKGEQLICKTLYIE